MIDFVIEFTQLIAGMVIMTLFLFLSNKRLKRFSLAIVFIDARIADQRATLSRLDRSRGPKDQVKKLKAVAYGRLQELGKIRSFLTGEYKWEK